MGYSSTSTASEMLKYTRCPESGAFVIQLKSGSIHVTGPIVFLISKYVVAMHKVWTENVFRFKILLASFTALTAPTHPLYRIGSCCP